MTKCWKYLPWCDVYRFIFSCNSLLVGRIQSYNKCNSGFFHYAYYGYHLNLEYTISVESYDLSLFPLPLSVWTSRSKQLWFCEITDIVRTMVLHVDKQLLLYEARFNGYYSFFGLGWSQILRACGLCLVFRFSPGFVQFEILIFTDGQTYRQINKLHQDIRKVF